MTSKTPPVAADSDTLTTTEQSCWIFAYGSLIWRPGFDYSERSRAYITGWKRRFWQASTDHRGRPGAPGRVVTLVREPGAICEGVAYRIDGNITATLAYLDQREQGGYVRHRIEADLNRPDTKPVQALTYVADENNCHYVGPDSDDRITRTIATAAGPSGTNYQYCLQLVKALSKENIHDYHVQKIADRVKQLTTDKIF